MQKAKQLLTILCFAAVIYGFFAAMLVKEDAALSFSERRKLQQFPTLQGEALWNGEFTEDLELYLQDQFPARDTMRRVKAVTAFDVLRRRDNNGIYLQNGSMYKLEYPLHEGQVLLAAQKLNDLYDTYLSGMPVYYAVIPDKNYFAAAQNDYPSMDYAAMKELLRTHISSAEEIELFDCLTAEDYYRTDPHWRQDRLDRVTARLGSAMSVSLPPLSAYETNSFAPFYGAYLGQSALAAEPDEIRYLTSSITQTAELYSYETDHISSLYTPEAYDGMDGYDLFLSGASAFQIITNPQNDSGRELLIFRDSFGSSLAPLLLPGYSKITLIDLRYMSSELLPSLLTFGDQDVLFLYSTLVLNHSETLK